jgi:hypothetical protein
MNIIIYKKQIPHICTIDKEDIHIIGKYKWFVNRWGYVERHTTINNKWVVYLLHRCILNITDHKIEIDHINNDPLDNRKCNLRICNRFQNAKNRKSQKHSSSKYLGVSHFTTKYRAIIFTNNKNKHLGYYVNEIDAAKAYDKAAKLYHGEFANLNFK